jgi:hypothetical protein
MEKVNINVKFVILLLIVNMIIISIVALNVTQKKKIKNKKE